MSDGACAVKFTLTRAAAVGLCIGLCVRPRTTGALFGMAAGYQGGVGRIRSGVGSQALDAGRDDGLGRLFARAAGFEGAADGAAALCVGVGPDGETYAVVGNGACGGGLGLSARSGRWAMAEEAWGSQVGGGGADEGIVGVGIRVGRGGGGAVADGEYRGAEKVAGGGRRKGRVGRGEGKCKGVDGRRRLQRRRNDLDLARERELSR